MISCFCFRLDFLFYKKKKSKMVRLNVDQMSRYVSPVNPSAFPTLAISLLGKTIEMNIKNSFLKLHSRYWRFFNGMVFCLWGHKYEIYTWLENRNSYRSVRKSYLNFSFENDVCYGILVLHQFFSATVVCFSSFGLEYSSK